MGQFKPMVKMTTDEPSVELKLKKGGSVSHKCMKKGGSADTGFKKIQKMADGGLPSMVGTPTGGLAPSASPSRPSLAQRRAAMSAPSIKVTPKKGAMKPRANPPKGAKVIMPAMKEGGETPSEHKAEMKKLSSIEKTLKSHASKPASKAHAGLKTGGIAKGVAGYKTGGVVKGQAGYKTGGVVKGQGGYKTGGVVKGQCGYKDGGIIRSTAGMTKVDTAKPNTSPAMTGDIKKNGIAGFKKGGKMQKFANGGSVQDDGRAQKMPQGAKKPTSPVAINQLSGTFKKGGTVGNKKLQAVFNKENAPAMKAAKANSNLKYKKGGKVKGYADGGTTDATNRPVGTSPMPSEPRYLKPPEVTPEEAQAEWEKLLATYPPRVTQPSVSEPSTYQLMDDLDYLNYVGSIHPVMPPELLQPIREPFAPQGSGRGASYFDSAEFKAMSPEQKQAYYDKTNQLSMQLNDYQNGVPVNAVQQDLSKDLSIYKQPAEPTVSPKSSVKPMTNKNPMSMYGVKMGKPTQDNRFGIAPKASSVKPAVQRPTRLTGVGLGANVTGKPTAGGISTGKSPDYINKGVSGPGVMVGINTPEQVKAFNAMTPAQRKAAVMKKGGKVKKYADGGSIDESFAPPSEQLAEMRRRKAMEQGYKGTRERETASNEALLDSLTSLPKGLRGLARKAMRDKGAVTDTQTTVSRTVTPPAKKRGGKVCK